MKKNIIYILLITLIFLTSCGKKSTAEKVQKIELEKSWRSETEFKNPESVIYDAKNDILYVANINGNPSKKDGNGFISKLKTNGEIDTYEWITGLNAPKGMGIFEDTLFVTDINAVSEINISEGKIKATYDLNGEFLNDITVDQKGNVYISDMTGSKIFKLKDGKFDVWMDSDTLNNPNGLIIEKNRLLVASSSTGTLADVNLKSKKIKLLASGCGTPDGLIMLEKDIYLMSNWQGQLFVISSFKQLKKVLDTRENKIYSADIGYVPEQKLVLVPTFYDNHVDAYKVIEQAAN